MGPLSGVRVLEVATHVFVPMAGAVLAEWGAEVTKIEHPLTGDPYRGLVTAGLHKVYAGVDVQFQAANRGKRSVGLDLGNEEGRSVLGRMLAGTDVFVTNLRPAARAKLRLDPDDVRANNPAVVYVRGSAFGPDGPDKDRGGYDAGAYWARSGMQQVLRRPSDDYPAIPPAAFGDVVAGLTLAGAVGVALYKRATGGGPSVIDASLLASGMWQVQMDVMNAQVDPERGGWRPADRHSSWNPLMLPYRTSDGRFVILQMLAPDPHWPDLCRAIGVPEMVGDPRFANLDARRQNARECIERLDRVFATRTLAEWTAALADFGGEWVPSQVPAELSADPQVAANGYLREVDLGNGHSLPTVAVPVQFDGEAGSAIRAPEHGQHTEEVLLSMGLSWAEISELKARGVVL